MKIIGSLLLAVIVGVLLVWLLLELLVGAIQLVGILIAVGLAAVVFFVAQKMIGKGN